MSFYKHNMIVLALIFIILLIILILFLLFFTVFIKDCDSISVVKLLVPDIRNENIKNTIESILKSKTPKDDVERAELLTLTYCLNKDEQLKTEAKDLILKMNLSTLSKHETFRLASCVFRINDKETNAFLNTSPFKDENYVRFCTGQKVVVPEKAYAPIDDLLAIKYDLRLNINDWRNYLEFYETNSMFGKMFKDPSLGNLEIALVKDDFFSELLNYETITLEDVSILAYALEIRNNNNLISRFFLGTSFSVWHHKEDVIFLKELPYICDRDSIFDLTKEMSLNKYAKTKTVMDVKIADYNDWASIMSFNLFGSILKVPVDVETQDPPETPPEEKPVDPPEKPVDPPETPPVETYFQSNVINILDFNNTLHEKYSPDLQHPVLIFYSLVETSFTFKNDALYYGSKLLISFKPTT